MFFNFTTNVRLLRFRDFCDVERNVRDAMKHRWQLQFDWTWLRVGDGDPKVDERVKRARLHHADVAFQHFRLELTPFRYLKLQLNCCLIDRFQNYNVVLGDA
jgi:hypothetical protein